MKFKFIVPCITGLALILVAPAAHLFAAKPVLLGIDVLEDEEFEPLKDAHVALITNQTGLNRTLESTVDIFHQAKNFKLICIMTPEHGFRGDVPQKQTFPFTVSSGAPPARQM